MADKNISGELAYIFPDRIREGIRKTLARSDLTEIRLRSGLPMMMKTLDREYYVTKEGCLSKKEENIFVITPEDMKIIFQKISQYSVFAFKEELSEGFLTLKGGHRIGLCGKMYHDSDGKRQLQHISSMNVRIARQVAGCSRPFFPFLINGDDFCHTLLISPPGYGKTTFLRDLIQIISDGTGTFMGKNISVVDERSEIGNRTRASEGFYLGKRTDLLDHCPKAEGMLLMLRAMGPQVIAVDEIGETEDIHALKYIRNCGCKLLMTVHGKDVQDVLLRPYLGDYLKKYPFERYVVIQIGKRGKREIEVYDQKQRRLWSSREGDGAC